MSDQSPIQFPGDRRIHIALAVRDLARSQAFYATLLGSPPAKIRPGYAKFEPEDPSVNFTLNEVPQSGPIGKPATHYGIQVKSTDAVQEAIDRFRAADLPIRVQEDTACCYAVQDKVWVTDPDGNEWEVFVVLEADSPHRSDTGSSCCVPSEADEPSDRIASPCCEQ